MKTKTNNKLSEMIACGLCGETKAYREFPLDRNMPRGIGYRCKECRKEEAKKRRMTPVGFIEKIYYSHSARQRKNFGICLPYSKSELIEHTLSNKAFEGMWEEYVRSGFDRSMSPSYDRIDDYKPYSFENMTLVKFEENRRRSHSDRRNGINNKVSRGVTCLSTGVKYHSVRHAERMTGVCRTSIARNCKNKKSYAGGFSWAYTGTDSDVWEEMKVK